MNKLQSAVQAAGYDRWREVVLARLRVLDFLLARPWLWLVPLSLYFICREGYVYPGWDHVGVQLLLVKHFNNPSLYPNDPFIATLRYYFTPFWIGVAFLSRAWDVGEILFALHLVSRFFTLLVFYALAWALFQNEKVAWLAVLLNGFGLRGIALGGSTMLATAATHSSVAFPILLFALVAWFRGKMKIAFLLTGIAFNFHPMLAGFFIFIFGFHDLVERRGDLLVHTLYFLVPAVPTIWLMLRSIGSGPTDPQWLEVIRVRAPHHIFPSTWSVEAFATFLLFACLSVLSLRASPPDWMVQRKAILFSVAVILLLALGTIFVEVYPVGFIVKMHLFRSSELLVFLGSIYISAYLYSSWASGWLNRLMAIGIFISLITHQYPLSIPVAVILGLEGMRRERMPFKAFSALAVALLAGLGIGPFRGMILSSLPIVRAELSDKWLVVLAASLLAALYLWTLLQRTKPVQRSVLSLLSVLIVGWASLFLLLPMIEARSPTMTADFIDVQRWARENTPPEAKFITPPTLVGFRMYSERPIVGDWKDGMAAFWAPSFAPLWWEEMKDLQATGESGKPGNYGDLREGEFLRIARKYVASYVVVSKETQLEFEKVYENNSWAIYRVESR